MKCTTYRARTSEPPNQTDSQIKFDKVLPKASYSLPHLGGGDAKGGDGSSALERRAERDGGYGAYEHEAVGAHEEAYSGP